MKLTIILEATTFTPPISYLVMDAFLYNIYDYHIPVQFTSIASGVVAIFIIAFLTVSALVVEVMRDNPVEALRNIE